MTPDKITMASIEDNAFSEGNPKTAREIADEFLKYADLNAIADELARLYDDNKVQRTSLDDVRRYRTEETGIHNKLVENTQLLLIEAWESGLDHDEIKTFAEENNLTLQREVRVTFRVDADYTILQDIMEGDGKEITESDFAITIEYRGDDDIDNEEYEVNGFDAEVQ